MEASLIVVELIDIAFRVYILYEETLSSQVIANTRHKSEGSGIKTEIFENRHENFLFDPSIRQTYFVRFVLASIMFSDCLISKYIHWR